MTIAAHTFRSRRATRLAALLPVLLVAGAASAQEPGMDPRVLREIFARPAVIPFPSNNPMSKEKVALGRRLFFDARLSIDGRRSCASCHRPEFAFTDALPRAIGRSGSALRRNTPHLFNLAWGRLYYWDGRADSLEAQARVPLTTPDEMGASLSTIIDRLAADPRTRSAFARAFPESPHVSEPGILAAIATYERTLVAPPTRFDRFISGATSALSSRERDGLRLFIGRGQCITCHGGWRFTDDKFHDIGLGGSDPGRGAIAGGIPGLSAFKTPSLRLVSRTAPYMHDGALRTLDAVVAHYSDRIVERPGLATNVVRNLRLSPDEKRALVSFLRTL